MTTTKPRTILIAIDDSTESEKALVWTLDNFYKCVTLSLSLARSLARRVGKSRDGRERRESEKVLFVCNGSPLAHPLSLSTSCDLDPLSLLSLLFPSLPPSQARGPHPPDPRHPAPATRGRLRRAARGFLAAAGKERFGCVCVWGGGEVCVCVGGWVGESLCSFSSFPSDLPPLYRPFLPPFSLRFPPPNLPNTRTRTPTSSSSRTQSTLSPSASSLAFCRSAPTPSSIW